ncbi:iron-only hydrogenase system regulator [Clostridiales bacterium COT073_COT-073]|nr:iron-only hydrogenase system regulator [Clostridiales bacterium COT073_COT-073]
MNRLALIGIIVEELEQSEKINELLHEYGRYIVGRMGIPYRERGVSVISIVIDAPNDAINSLSGKLGKIEGVKAKTMFTKME